MSLGNMIEVAFLTYVALSTAFIVGLCRTAARADGRIRG
jgi:hypothetical protein